MAVATLADAAIEGDESMTLRLSDANGAVLADGEATGTISDASPSLTARVVEAPAAHGGKGSVFRLRIEFSAGIARGALRPESFEVKGGAAKRTSRVDGANDLWEASFKAKQDGAMTMSLPVAPDCAVRGAVCTPDGRALSAPLSTTVPGPAAAGATVDGAVLTLTWPTPRDGFAAPDGSDFAVRVAGAWRRVVCTSVRGRQVVLALERPALPGDEAAVDYLGSAMHPLRPAGGKAAQPWEDLPVANVTVPASPPGPPGSVAGGTAGRRSARMYDPGPPWIADRPPGHSLSLAASGLADDDLAVLARASGVRRLDLSDNALEDLSALAHLRRLESLDLSGNGVRDLWPLAGLAALRRLDLSDNRIVDISALAAVPTLEVLLLDGNAVEDVGPLTQLLRLENLGLRGSAVGDVSPLADLVALRRLDLGGAHPVGDPSPLGDLGATLMWLRLPDSAVGAPAHRLVRLRWLRQAGAGTCIACGTGGGQR